MKFPRWIEAFWELFFPRLCVVCEVGLADGEEGLCTLCNIRLPRTNQHLCRNNGIEKMFWGKIHLERATSYFYYSKGSSYNRIVHHFKYRGKKELGEVMGRMMARELLQSDFFSGIDLLVPVPLHPKREKKRGYNQSEWLVRGISDLTGIPYRTDLVERILFTDTQTHQSVFDRLENTKEAFEWSNPEELVGKHLLLVDDVLTTGSTLLSCLLALGEREQIRISILTLCATH